MQPNWNSRDWNCTPDIIYTELAQLEERGPYKADVMGSSPLLRTMKDPHSKIFLQNCKFWMKFLLGLVYAPVVELVDSQAWGACA